MNALTLKHPWPWAIRDLGKRIENRTWVPSDSQRGEWFALHGGKAPKTEREKQFVCRMAAMLDKRFYVTCYSQCLPIVVITGIFAVCRLGRTITESADRWFEGPIGWELDDLVLLPRPIPCRGMQGLWPVPDRIVAEVRAQYAEARRSVGELAEARA